MNRIFFLLGAAVLIVLVMKGRAMKSANLNIERFAPVPRKPNCVSSEAAEEDRTHFIAPLRFVKPVAEAKAAMIRAIQSMPRTKLAIDDGNYLRFEFRSALLGFIDDVEFRFDGDSRTVRVRSASRVGYSDLGVNRKRIEAIRQLLAEKI